MEAKCDSEPTSAIRIGHCGRTRYSASVIFSKTHYKSLHSNSWINDLPLFDATAVKAVIANIDRDKLATERKRSVHATDIMPLYATGPNSSVCQ